MEQKSSTHLCCNDLRINFNSGAIIFDQEFFIYGKPRYVNDGDNHFDDMTDEIRIVFCPFCGSRLSSIQHQSTTATNNPNTNKGAQVNISKVAKFEVITRFSTDVSNSHTGGDYSCWYEFQHDDVTTEPRSLGLCKWYKSHHTSSDFYTCPICGSMGDNSCECDGQSICESFSTEELIDLLRVYISNGLPVRACYVETVDVSCIDGYTINGNHSPSYTSDLFEKTCN